MGRYFDELKRRNVFRVAAAYAVVGWLAIEVVDTLAPRMAMPEWVPGFVIILVLVGFPIALLFSWAFEMTPEGLRKTEEVDADASITSTTGQKINYIIIAALAAVVLLQQFTPSLSTLSPFSDVANEAAPIPIAVLPFADLSPEGDQEYLGDGVAEEILNVLAGVDGLKVTSRTSAFAFKNENRPIPEIAAILGVSHVVEGSIRKQNNRVRITAQLIEVTDDSHLWSESYNSDLNDIFRLQEEIADQISAALSKSLNLTLPAAERKTPDWDVAAYEHYLRARQLVVARERFTEAIEMLDAALSIEPDLADAWAEKAAALTLVAFDLGQYDETIAEAYKTYDEAWSAARRATELEPNHPLGLAVKGLIRMNQYRWVEGRVFLERAVSVKNPSDYAYLWLGILQSLTGHIDGALASFDAGLATSPTAPNLHRWRAQILLHLGRWQDVWDTRTMPAELAMPDTLFAQQIAALHLGKITIDDFIDWFETDVYRPPEQSAELVAFIRNLGANNTSPIAASKIEEFLAFDEDLHSDILDIWPELVSPYFEKIWREILVGPNNNKMQYIWRDNASGFRRSPQFTKLVRGLNLPAYWELYGWPDACRPIGDSDFECD